MSTLKVDTIQKRTGTGTITVGQSGDTIAMPSVTLTTALPVAQGGTGGTSFSAAGLSNTSAFMARLSSNQSVSSGSFTKIVFNAEDFDTDSNFDTSNGRFTPTTAGKYWCYTSLAVDAVNSGNNIYSAIYFNGSHANGHSALGFCASNGGTTTSSIGATFTFNGSSDYIEVYGLHNYGSSRNFIGNSTTECVFTAYRLIGV